MKLPFRHVKSQLQLDPQIADRFYVFQHLNQRFVAEIVERSNYILMNHIQTMPVDLAKHMFTERMKMVRGITEGSAKKYWSSRTLEQGVNLSKHYLPRNDYVDTMSKLPHRQSLIDEDVDMTGYVECELVMYTPKITKEKLFAKGKLIIYLPGGAFVLGSHRTHRSATMFLSRSIGCTVLAVNYRKAPEAAYPEPVEDALMAYMFALKTLKFAPKDIVIMGDSAGGTVAALTTHMINSGAACNYIFAQPVGGTVLWSPWLDLACNGTSWTDNLDWMTPQTLIPPTATYHPSSLFVRKLGTGKKSLQSPLVSPLFFDWSVFGPVLIQSGSHDSTASDAEAAAAILSRIGSDNWSVEIYEKVGHIFMLGGGSCSAIACTRMFDFFRRLWGVSNISAQEKGFQRVSTPIPA